MTVAGVFADLLRTLSWNQDYISHGRYLAGFIHACHIQQPQLAAKLMRDVIAEPYRTRLLPGFAAARKAVQDIGALACGISGYGPTLFSVCNDVTAAQASGRLAEKSLSEKRRRFCLYLMRKSRL